MMNLATLFHESYEDRPCFTTYDLQPVVLPWKALNCSRFIGAVTNTGRTALHLASVNGHRKCLNILLGGPGVQWI